MDSRRRLLSYGLITLALGFLLIALGSGGLFIRSMGVLVVLLSIGELVTVLIAMRPDGPHGDRSD